MREVRENEKDKEEKRRRRSQEYKGCRLRKIYGQNGMLQKARTQLRGGRGGGGGPDNQLKPDFFEDAIVFRFYWLKQKYEKNQTILSHYHACLL